MSQADCPDTGAWQALLDGTEEESDRLVGHLEVCADCRRTLEGLAAEAAVWQEAAQALAARRAGHEPALCDAVQRLKSGQPPAEEDGGLWFLQPADKPELLGLLGPYEVLEEIGRGGMGVVLKAFEPELHRLVAIKVLASGLAGNPTARLRFKREGKAVAAVCHENVVAVHGVGEVNGLPYLVMQYVAGESLQDRLDRAGPLPVEEAVRIGRQTASGLAAAHAQGLIHRDIKPANLLLENGVARVKITDFGLVRMTDDAGLTQQGVVAGTPEYMAPEQARGEAIDHRADLYGLGGVLYACCTGRPPFRASTALGVLRRVAEEAPAPVRSLNPKVPAWLEVVIMRLLAKDPAERFQSAAEVATLLEGYLAHLRQPRAVPAPALAPPGRALTRALAGRRGRLLIGLGLAALPLAAILALAVAGWHSAGQGAAPEAAGSGRQHLVYDFRKRIDDLPGLALFGPDAESLAQTDARGLRINLPADRPGCEQGVGVELASRIRGDFDINVGYEILAIGEPIPQGGAGVQMRLQLDPSGPMETVTRLRTPFGARPVPLYTRVGHEGDIFAAFRITLLPNGINETGFSEGVRVRSMSPAGGVRLTRTGSQLEYLAADEGQPYCLLRRAEVGTADAELLRVFGFTGWGPVAVDVRLTDLTIDADALPDAPAAISLPAQLDWSKAWLSAALIAGLLVSLAVGVAFWLWARRRRPAAEAPSPPAAAARPGWFACPGCGTRLRARPDQAGKRAKCPKCAQAMQLPATAAGRDESPAAPAAG